MLFKSILKKIGPGLAVASLSFSLSMTAHSAPPAAPATNTTKAVATLLSGYEYAPTTEDWGRAGPSADVAAALMAVVQSSPRQLQRSRAMSSLAHLPSPNVERFLEQRTADTALSARLRGKALIAWAYQAKDRVAVNVVAFLAHPNVDLREDAVRALRHMSAESVAVFVRTRVQIEPVPHVKLALQQTATLVDQNRAALTAKRLPIPTVMLPPIAAPIRVP
ncbi:MAG: hypothetical protein ACI9MR_001478 [Myxococcota bacterium]|jgi:hypothetical protein